MCRVVMDSRSGAAQVQKNLFNQELFGEIIKATLEKLEDEDKNPVDFDLDDGSKSWKMFKGDSSTSTWPETGVAPTKVKLGTSSKHSKLFYFRFCSSQD